MLTLTERAQSRLREVLETQAGPAASVRVEAVRGPHGCIHAWRLAVSEHPDPKDTAVQAGSVRVLVEPDLAQDLDGARIDYREDSLGIGFVIEAPHAAMPGQHHGHGQGGCQCHH